MLEETNTYFVTVAGGVAWHTISCSSIAVNCFPSRWAGFVHDHCKYRIRSRSYFSQSHCLIHRKWQSQFNGFAVRPSVFNWGYGRRSFLSMLEIWLVLRSRSISKDRLNGDFGSEVNRLRCKSIEIRVSREWKREEIERSVNWLEDNFNRCRWTNGIRIGSIELRWQFCRDNSWRVPARPVNVVTDKFIWAFRSKLSSFRDFKYWKGCWLAENCRRLRARFKCPRLFKPSRDWLVNEFRSLPCNDR